MHGFGAGVPHGVYDALRHEHKAARCHPYFAITEQERGFPTGQIERLIGGRVGMRWRSWFTRREHPDESNVGTSGLRRAEPGGRWIMGGAYDRTTIHCLHSVPSICRSTGAPRRSESSIEPDSTTFEAGLAGGRPGVHLPRQAGPSLPTPGGSHWNGARLGGIRRRLDLWLRARYPGVLAGLGLGRRDRARVAARHDLRVGIRFGRRSGHAGSLPEGPVRTPGSPGARTLSP